MTQGVSLREHHDRIVALHIQGMTDADIARQLGVSARGVGGYRDRHGIRRKGLPEKLQFRYALNTGTVELVSRDRFEVVCRYVDSDERITLSPAYFDQHAKAI